MALSNSNLSAADIEMMKVSWRTWVFPVIVFIFIAASAVLVLYPQYQEIQTKRTELKAAETTLAVLKEKRQFLEALNEDQLKDQRARLETIIPSSKPVYSFVTALTELSKQSEIIIESYTLKPGELATESAEAEETAAPQEVEGGPGQFSTIPIEIEVTSKFSQLVHLFELIEKMSPLVEVNGYDLTGELGSAQKLWELGNLTSEDLKTALILNLYWSLRPVQISAIDQPIVKISSREEAAMAKMDQFEEFLGDGIAIPPQVDYQRENIFTLP